MADGGTIDLKKMFEPVIREAAERFASLDIDEIEKLLDEKSKGGTTMSTEAQIRAKRKYDAESMTSVSVRISKKTAQRFTEACDKLGVSKYSVLKKRIYEVIAEANLDSDTE